MLADGGALTTWGAIAGIFTTVTGVGLTYWATKINARSKKNEQSMKGYELSQSAMQNGMTWVESHNARLRSDLTQAEGRIEELEKDNDRKDRRITALEETIEENETQCRRKLTALAKEIQQLRGITDE